jgi:hypothetical protein
VSWGNGSAHGQAVPGAKTFCWDCRQHTAPGAQICPKFHLLNTATATECGHAKDGCPGKQADFRTANKGEINLLTPAAQAYSENQARLQTTRAKADRGQGKGKGKGGGHQAVQPFMPARGVRMPAPPHSSGRGAGWGYQRNGPWYGPAQNNVQNGQGEGTALQLYVGGGDNIQLYSEEQHAYAAALWECQYGSN